MWTFNTSAEFWPLKLLATTFTLTTPSLVNSNYARLYLQHRRIQWNWFVNLRPILGLHFEPTSQGIKLRCPCHPRGLHLLSRPLCPRRLFTQHFNFLNFNFRTGLLHNSSIFRQLVHSFPSLLVLLTILLISRHRVGSPLHKPQRLILLNHIVSEIVSRMQISQEHLSLIFVSDYQIQRFTKLSGVHSIYIWGRWVLKQHPRKQKCWYPKSIGIGANSVTGLLKTSCEKRPSNLSPVSKLQRKNSSSKGGARQIHDNG